LGSHAAELAKIATARLLDDGFEPIVSLTVLTDRTISCVVSISYDRNLPGEDEKALRCHDRLLRELNQAGYFPYRLGLQSMSQMETTSGYSSLLRMLKETMDPNRILAPGRYEAFGEGEG